MKALLLLAGRGTRLNHYTQENHKSLLNLNGMPLILHIMDRIIENGIKDFIIVVGFQKESIIKLLTEKYPQINLKFIENPIYENTNTLYSMYLAKDEITEEFVYFHGDILFNKNILKKLLKPCYENGAIVESNKESMQAFGFDSIVTRISKKKDALGKALGIYKFSKEATERLFQEAEKIILSGELNTFQSEAINPTIINHKMHRVGTDNLGWIEIDDEEDLLDAEKVLNQILKEESKENVRNMWI